MSSSVLAAERPANGAVRSLVYRDLASKGSTSGHKVSGLAAPSSADHGPAESAPADLAGSDAHPPRAEVEMSHQELARRIQQERAEAVREAEQRIRREYEGKLEAERTLVRTAIADFAQERDQYFGRAEAEIVQLALAIAAKILHREAQVDPMLLASLVRIAVEKLRKGSSATVRVGKGKGERWRIFFAEPVAGVRVKVEEDAALSDQDCLLETELGMANFSLEAQLKEVEHGFFDLLALRPGKGSKKR